MNHPPVDWEPQIQHLRYLSLEMLELAQANDWEAVSEWETRRRAVLDNLFRQPAPAAIVPLLEEAIRATLASDARLTDMARAEMDSISDNLKLIQQGRRAMLAYHDF
ncbi:flagellar protein FliT [Candidatus Contendibacter odensensis]|uniref:Flagellar protein FliT n=1 Tax=Candidatus Contendobacter odensis Run_B_J11 TaxID=1400861 RepID=A0A7U7G9X2_9GAMM|nr:flagellar protein FliT [Candidatus Contendobacter odensis]CDH44161.1 putative fliT domain protein [Candidatus Contendobacter odensis Run_B_J11]